MKSVRIYHNPRCSKSRQTLALLQERGLDVEVIRYLEDPPAPAELDRLVEALGMAPVELIRVKEKRFAELGLATTDDRSRREWLELMSANPILIERPIVVNGERAALGRPPEEVLAIL